MQRLKEEIRESILSHAGTMFLEKGYSATSMREIAAKIPMSVSNLYKYYPDKLSLYKSFVVPVYQVFIQRMDEFLAEENDGNYTEENIRYVSESLYQRISKSKTAFLLLMNNPEVEPFHNFREIVCNKMMEHLLEDIEVESGFDPFIIHILVKNIWDGLYEIFKNESTEATKRDQVYHLLQYHFMGISLFHEK